MTQKQLEIFTTLAETLNFTRTSEYLYLSQTTVTLQIKNLEEELGVSLFDRTSRSVSLTAAGNAFREGAVRILELMETTAEKTRMIGKEFTGDLSIGFATEANATGMADMIDLFAKANKKIRIRIHGGYPAELMERLVKEEYDIILGPDFEKIRTLELNTFVMREYPLVAAFRKDHPFAKRKYVTCEDFAGEKLIYVGNPDLRLNYTNHFIQMMNDRNIHPDLIALSDDIEAVLIMLESGLGITVLPEYLKGRFHGTSGLKTCRLKEDLRGVAFSAMWKKGKHSKELDAFTRHLKNYYTHSAAQL